MSGAFALAPGSRERLAEYAGIFRGSAVWDRYFRTGGRLQQSLEKAAGRGELWCAHTPDGALVGVMRVVPWGFCGLYHYLSLIGTAPPARGTGAGCFLMGEFERMARADGCRRTSLLVSDFNASAMEFYRALGYWELGSIPDAVRPGIAERVLLKDLET